MSETKKIYKTDGGISSLSALRDLPCALPYCSAGYCHPTPKEVGSLIRLAGWSQREVALIAGVNHNQKGSTTVRKWKTESGNESRSIPYAAWRQMLEVAGVVTVDEVREALQLSIQNPKES
jgi:hypothetical protein